LGWMILGTWMYSLALKLERFRTRRAQVEGTRALVPLPVLLVTPASTSTFEEFFVASGKMPVVVGVAAIIVLGLGLWWVRAVRELRRLQSETPDVTSTPSNSAK